MSKCAMRLLRAALRSILLVSTLTMSADALPQSPIAALLRSGSSDATLGKLEVALAEQVRNAGYDVRDLSMGDLCDPAKVDAQTVDLLVLPNAAELPAPSTGVVEAYLKAGGDILALNAPLWQRPLFEDNGAWVPQAAYRERHAGDLMQHVLFDFPAGALEGWRRSTNEPSIKTTHELVGDVPAPAHNALHVTMADMKSWETFASPDLAQPFPEGHSLTVFYAKGAGRTGDLSIEWNERDGSRWIATVILSDEWQQYVLEPKDFKFWESVPERKDTVFNPANAVRVCIGLSHTHTQSGGGPHEYWMGAFGSAERTPVHEKLLTHFNVPVLDALCPAHKFFPCRDVASIRVQTDQAVAQPRPALPVPEIVCSPQPRPKAGGFDKGRDWRWLPLLEARTADARWWRGTPAAMLVHADGPHKGGVWTSFAVGNLDWYLNPEVLAAIGDAAKATRQGVFLVDGGADYYTYFENQAPVLGITAVNVSREARNDIVGRVGLAARASDPSDPSDLSDSSDRSDRSDKSNPAPQAQWTFNLGPGERKRFETALPALAWPQQGFAATATLTQNGQTLDMARHEVHVWKPKDKPSFITVKNGDFMLDGKRWRAHGVNYMPSSGIGTEDWKYFEQWIGARAYDPEVIQRDLDHVKDMGMNSVSIFIYREAMEAQNLLDLLRRLDAMGMKANLSLRPGTPMEFLWDQMRDLIEYYRLRENDCVFAYDLAWEPLWGNHDARKQWDAAWRDWIVERYGSFENAEKDWAFAAVKDENGLVANPLDNQVVDDGEWRRMVAAYRRFLDTLLYDKYSRARTLVRSIDPNHLVSFRMTEAGDPTFNWPGQLPYDFPYLAAAVDLLEPEAYGRIGDWERVKPGWFEYEYARWAAPHLPMIWAEAGVSAWSISKMTATPEQLQFEADYYTDLYRMFIGSAADGIFFWWYPGGYRTNERSDYGIIEPDGSDRPVTKVIRDHAAAFLDGPDAKPIDLWLEIDRDLLPVGLNGAYNAVKDAFWQAIADGKTPGLKTAATGSNSANCPLAAVGNTPCNGNNPPKHLDAFFDLVEIKDAGGNWVPVERGGTVKVTPGQPVVARITLTNLGEAEWLSPESHPGEGGVYVVAQGAATTKTALPKSMPRFVTRILDNVTIASEATASQTTVTLTLTAVGRAQFGPRFVITLVP